MTSWHDINITNIMTWHDNVMMKDMSKTVLGCSLARTRGPTTSPPVYGMADLWEIRQSFSKLAFTQFKYVQIVDDGFSSLQIIKNQIFNVCFWVSQHWDFLSVRWGKGVSLLRYFIQAAWNLRREPTENPGMVHVGGPRIGGAVGGGGQRRWSLWSLGLTLDECAVSWYVSTCFMVRHIKKYQESTNCY